MERSRLKRKSRYDHDYDVESIGRSSKPRKDNNSDHCSGDRKRGNKRHRSDSDTGNRQRSKFQTDKMVRTTYRVLCHEAKAGGVIGNSGSIVKSIQNRTGAWISVHELVRGDVERIIEISGHHDRRKPSFSPAREALLSVHERILEIEAKFAYRGAPLPEEEEDYGGVRPRKGRVVTRLVVSKMHLGCLFGRDGKTMEQIKNKTRTRIRVLSQESNLPRCVLPSEEIVQIVGKPHAVKNALAILSSRLREIQHERPSPPVDDCIPQQRSQSSDSLPHGSFSSRQSNNAAEAQAVPVGENAHTKEPVDDDIPQQRSQSSDSFPHGNSSFHQSNNAAEALAVPVGENAQPFYTKELVFRILCPVDKIVRVVGESQEIVDLLHNVVGVDVRVSEPVAGSDEQIITIVSEEAPDDQLFPAQEALLHIQTQIVDLISDKDNLITTRLVIPSRDSVCFEGKSESVSEISRLTGASIQILPREETLRSISINDVVIQITGEIIAARNALVELTLQLRSHMCKEKPLASTSTSGPLEGVAGVIEVASSSNRTQSREGLTGSNPNSQQASPITLQLKEESVAKADECEQLDEVPVTTSRMSVPLVTKSTLEVVLPDQVILKLVRKSRNKLAQISEWSGAKVDRPEKTQNIIRISGTPEQTEKAHILLKGFILSIQEDGP